MRVVKTFSNLKLYIFSDYLFILIDLSQVHQTRNGGYAIVNPGRGRHDMFLQSLNGERPVLFSSEEALNVMQTRGNGCYSVVQKPRSKYQDFVCQVSLADIMKGGEFPFSLFVKNCSPTG